MKAAALRIMQMEIPEYAKGDQELWTPKLVKEALIDAFRMLNRTGGRVGPAGLKAYWPEYAVEGADFIEQSIAGNLRQQRAPKPSYATRMTVTRMEMVMTGWRDDEGVEHPSWLKGPLDAAPELRTTLLWWVHAELRGEATVELCKRRRFALATFKRHRDRAAGIIAQRLNAAGIEVW
jgi:hypothetical protein